MNGAGIGMVFIVCCNLIGFVCVMWNISKWHSFLNEPDVPHERLPFYYARKSVYGTRWDKALNHRIPRTKL